MIIVLIHIVYADNITIVTPPDFYGYNAMQKIMYHDDGLRYKRMDNGATKVYDQGRLAGVFSFGLTGTINNISRVYTVEDFEWEWEMIKTPYSYNITVEEVDDNNESFNHTYVYDYVNYTFIATNRNSQFQWKQMFHFS